MESVETNNDLQSRRLSLIDFASEDDFLLSSPSCDLSDLNSLVITKEDVEQKSIEQSEAVESSIIEERTDTFEQREHGPQLLPSLEPERIRKNGKYNLRKSLAWDSAFFTSAGVLEPEELSSMIEQGDKNEKHVLPAILEDIQKSSDSISTLESEKTPFESTEGSLFEDVRASIQKSSRQTSLGSKAESGRLEARKPPPSRRTDLTSLNKIKDRPAVKKQTLQGAGRIIKQSSPQPQGGQQVKVVAELPSSSTLSNKRPSSGPNLSTTENHSIKSAAGKGASAGKNSAHKLTQIPSGVKKEQTTSSRISANSSENVGKSSLNSVRRKIESKASPSSGFTRKIPSQIAPKVKTHIGNSHCFSPSISTNKHSSGISPASSISEWSTESSSSSTLELQPNNSRASFHSITSKRVSIDRDISHGGSNHAVGPRTQGTGLLSQSVKKASAQSSILPPAKPSGLRLPSPKIGYFDGAKTSSIKSDPIVPVGLHKIAGSLNGGQNKTKPAKPQAARVSLKNTNRSSQLNTSNTNLKSHKPSTTKISKTNELDDKVKGLSSEGLDIALHDSDVPAESNQNSSALRENMSQENGAGCNLRDTTITCTDEGHNEASEQCSNSC